MRPTLRRLATALVLALIPALASAETDFPARTDGPYEGRLTVEVFPAGGGARLKRARGSGAVSFTPEADGTILMQGSGDVRDMGEMSFDARLTRSEDGIWRDLTGAGMTMVTPTGRIAVIVDKDDELFTMAGQIGEDGLVLELTHRRHPAADSTAESYTTVFRFDLREPTDPAAAVAATVGEGESDGNCSEVRWELRSSPNFFTGTYDLIRVPVCY